MTDTNQFFVRLCQCGVVHLSFGPAVIHATPETVIAITETLKEVSTGLRQKLKASIASHPAPVIRLAAPHGSV